MGANKDKTKKIQVHYYTADNEVSHSSNEVWKREDDEYCPSCGEPGVWSCDGNSDYYQGTPYLCLRCECKYWIPSMTGITHGADIQRVEALRTSGDSTVPHVS